MQTKISLGDCNEYFLLYLVKVLKDNCFSRSLDSSDDDVVLVCNGPFLILKAIQHFMLLKFILKCYMPTLTFCFYIYLNPQNIYSFMF